MVQMDIPAAFAFAQLFAWCGRRRLQQEEPAILGRSPESETADRNAQVRRLNWASRQPQ